jgi:type IV fimbrial biogenesis protein FimT
VPTQAGLSLTELLLAIALLGIVTGFAVPSFRALQLDTERSAQLNRFAQSIHLAGTGWESGWIMFHNQDRDAPAVRDADETIVQVYAPWERGQLRGNRATLSFRSFGQSGVTATYTFCDARGDEAARAVIVSQTGRPRITSRTASGDALSCE